MAVSQLMRCSLFVLLVYVVIFLRVTARIWGVGGGDYWPPTAMS